MSMSGSVILLCYLFSYPLTKRYFPAIWRYRILKTAMVFYLIPFSEYKYQIVGLMEKLFPVFWSRLYHSPEFDPFYSVIVTNGVMHFSSGLKWMMCLLILCGVISFIILFTWIAQYWKMKQVYLEDLEDLEDLEETVPKKYQQSFLDLKSEMGIRRKVTLVCSRHCGSPMTSGVLSPIVYVPHMEKDWPDMESFQYIIRHELIHIKRCDLLVKLLSLLVITIHWFNPLSFLLYKELSDMGEICCDEAVLERRGEKERKEYCELLLQTATQKANRPKRHFLTGMSNCRSRATFKRRILEMKVKKKNRLFLSMIIMGLICMAGGMTAFAYDPPKALEAGDQKVNFEIEFIDGIEPEEMIEIESMPYLLYFVDENGEVFELDEKDLSERAICNHNYGEKGTIKEHIKNSNGSCTIKIYEGRKCSKCGKILLEELISTIFSEYCLHG